jgi:hypothetical protein
MASLRNDLPDVADVAGWMGESRRRSRMCALSVCPPANTVNLTSTSLQATNRTGAGGISFLCLRGGVIP